MTDEILDVTDSTFDYEALGINVPALVYFYLSWSKSCRDLIEILEDLSEEYRNKILFFKLDIDKNSRVISRFGIASSPTLILFTHGDEINRLSGEIDEFELRDELDTFIQNIKIAKVEARDITVKTPKKKKNKSKEKKQRKINKRKKFHKNAK